MKLVRRMLIGLMVVSLVAACGSRPHAAPIAGDYHLYVVSSTPSEVMVAIVDSASQRTVGTLPLGVPSPDWQHYYAVVGGMLEDINPNSGVVMHTRKLDRAYQLPVVTIGGQPGGLSHNGRWLGLETAGPTHLLVGDTSFPSQPLAVDLSAPFNFGAVRDDRQSVYVIQHATNNHH